MANEPMATDPIVAEALAAEAGPRERSSAWPLAVVWIVLIVYASWHPFIGWRWPAHTGFTDLPALLWLPPPRHSSTFDIWSNFFGYLPLGGLIAVALLRELEAGWRDRLGVWRAVAIAGLSGALLSLSMEWGQSFLPNRVPSRVDWALNSAGSVVGAALALLGAKAGLLTTWQRLRNAWMVPHGQLGLSLLLSWPATLLFTPPTPFGLGQILVHLLELTETALEGTPWAATAAAWIASRDPGAQLGPGAEMLAITLGALAPCFVSYCMARKVHHRLVLLLGCLLLGAATTAMSTALNFGPDHGWAWVTPPVIPACILALILGFGLAWLPRRWVAALGLIALTALVVLVNEAGANPYVGLSLQAWEQGRFVRFHGLSQWLGWLWPFAALLFLLVRLTDRRRPA